MKYYEATFDTNCKCVNSFKLLDFDPNTISENFWFFDDEHYSSIARGNKYTDYNFAISDSIIYIKENSITEFINMYASNNNINRVNKIANIIIPAFREFKLNNLYL